MCRCISLFQAHISTKDWELAAVDFQRVVEINPRNTTAKKNISLCHTYYRDHETKTKDLLTGMFTKFANQDSKVQNAY